MTDNKNKTQVNLDEINPESIKHFSLIDLLMVIIIVGIVSLAIFPKMQDSKNEKIIINSLEKMQLIINANEKLKTETGDYAFDIDMLNLKDQIKDDYFQFVVNDTSIVAYSKNITTDSINYYYNINDKRFKISPNAKEIIDEAVFDRFKK
jgi:type II secretory pathway pseudopilin PulG